MALQIKALKAQRTFYKGLSDANDRKFDHIRQKIGYRPTWATKKQVTKSNEAIQRQK